jgi:hypothetical protein
MPAPWALPYLFCLQVSKQYILGVPSAPPPQIFAGRSGFLFSSPEKGWNGIENWEISKLYLWGGEGVLQGMVSF